LRRGSAVRPPIRPSVDRAMSSAEAESPGLPRTSAVRTVSHLYAASIMFGFAFRARLVRIPCRSSQQAFGWCSKIARHVSLSLARAIA
jgi:hypothetical protein